MEYAPPLFVGFSLALVRFQSEYEGLAGWKGALRLVGEELLGKHDPASLFPAVSQHFSSHSNFIRAPGSNCAVVTWIPFAIKKVIIRIFSLFSLLSIFYLVPTFLTRVDFLKKNFSYFLRFIFSPHFPTGFSFQVFIRTLTRSSFLLVIQFLVVFPPFSMIPLAVYRTV